MVRAKHGIPPKAWQLPEDQKSGHPAGSGHFKTGPRRFATTVLGSKQKNSCFLLLSGDDISILKQKSPAFSQSTMTAAGLR
jgi:hypothetical protein